VTRSRLFPEDVYRQEVRDKPGKDILIREDPGRTCATTELSLSLGSLLLSRRSGTWLITSTPSHHRGRGPRTSLSWVTSMTNSTITAITNTMTATPPNARTKALPGWRLRF